MRKVLFQALLACLISISSANAQYRENAELHAGHQPYNSDERRSPDRANEVLLGSSKITIEWSAPSLRDRDIFGRLVPPGGRIWRTGANEATVIHFDDDVQIEGKTLSAGNYALFTIGSAEEFTFIFNTVSQQWGAFGHNPDKDALRVTVDTVQGEHREELLLSFENNTDSSTDVLLAWGNITAAFSVRLASESDD